MNALKYIIREDKAKNKQTIKVR